MTQRKALLIGIDHYSHLKPLNGPVLDAKRIFDRLCCHLTPEKDPNFDCTLVISTGNEQGKQYTSQPGVCSHEQLFEQEEGQDIGQLNYQTVGGEIQAFFNQDNYPGQVSRDKDHKVINHLNELGILFFAGHGGRGKGEKGKLTQIITSELNSYDLGYSFSSLWELAHESINCGTFKELIIILDCCYSGAMGKFLGTDLFISRNGLGFLAASSPTQVSKENKHAGGFFSAALAEALEGSYLTDDSNSITISDITKYIGIKFSQLHKTNFDFEIKPQTPRMMSYIDHITTIRKVSDEGNIPSRTNEYIKSLSENPSDIKVTIERKPKQEIKDEKGISEKREVFQLLDKLFPNGSQLLGAETLKKVALNHPLLKDQDFLQGLIDEELLFTKSRFIRIGKTKTWNDEIQTYRLSYKGLLYLEIFRCTPREQLPAVFNHLRPTQKMKANWLKIKGLEDLTISNETYDFYRRLGGRK